MDRRSFVAGSLAFSSLIVPTRTTNAFWWVALEFLFAQGVRTAATSLVRGAVTRGVASTLARGALRREAGHATLRQAARNEATRPVTLGNAAKLFGSAASLTSSVLKFKSAEAAENFERGSPDVILVKSEPIYVSIRPSEEFSGNIRYSVVDMETGKVERTKDVIVSTCSYDKPFTFYIHELPFNGIKQLVGESPDNRFSSFRSNNLMLLSADELEVSS